MSNPSGANSLIRNVILSWDHHLLPGGQQGGSPGGTWTTFAWGTFHVSEPKRLITHATVSSFVDSALVTRDY